MTSRSRRPRSQGAEAGAVAGARSGGETRPPRGRNAPNRGRESEPAPGLRSPAASPTSGTTSSSIWMWAQVKGTLIQ